jgi:cell division protein FtsN
MNRQTLILALVLGAVLGLAACNREQSDWEKARADNSTEAYESFVKKYPNGVFTGQAQARLKEQYEERDWQKARDVDTSEAYQAFLLQYPEGKWSQEARIRVENFSLAQTTPGGPAPVEETSPGPGVPASQGAVSPPPSAASPGASPPAAPPPAPPKKAAATAPAPAATAKTASSAHSSGGELVQLGAFQSGKAAATHRWAQLKSKYPQALKGLEPVIRSAKAPHGTVYRLQVADLSHAAAHALCKTLAAHAEACIVVRETRPQ